MKRKELLEFLKSRVTTYYYEIADIWTKKHCKKFFLFETDFEVKPTISGSGYCIKASDFNWIHVYNR